MDARGLSGHVRQKPWSDPNTYPQVIPWLSPPLCMYTRPLVPGDGGSLWDELMGFVGEPIEDTPIVDEPTGYKVGTVNDDGTYEPRDRDDVIDEHHERELEQSRKEAAIVLEERERQRQSRYTLRSMGFVFTDEGTSAWEEMGGVVEYDPTPAPEHMFDPVPPKPGAFIPPGFLSYIFPL